jgi:hypothetical protein
MLHLPLNLLSLAVSANITSWFPGAGFKKVVLDGRYFSEYMRDRPWQATERTMVGMQVTCTECWLKGKIFHTEGTASHSVAAVLIESEDEDISKSVPATMCLAGTDTVRRACSLPGNTTLTQSRL